MGSGVGACVGGTAGTALGGVVIGGLSAAYGATSGAVGGAILNAAGYTGYTAAEAAQMGAAGNAVIYGTVGAAAVGIAGCLMGCGLFGNRKRNDNENSGSKGFLSYAALHVGMQTIGGLAGWSMMNSGESQTAMDLGQTAAAMATGSAITLIPASLITICIALPLVLAAIACAAATDSNREDFDEEVGNTVRMSA